MLFLSRYYRLFFSLFLYFSFLLRFLSVDVSSCLFFIFVSKSSSDLRFLFLFIVGRFQVTSFHSICLTVTFCWITFQNETAAVSNRGSCWRRRRQAAHTVSGLTRHDGSLSCADSEVQFLQPFHCDEHRKDGILFGDLSEAAETRVTVQAVSEGVNSFTDTLWLRSLHSPSEAFQSTHGRASHGHRRRRGWRRVQQRGSAFGYLQDALLCFSRQGDALQGIYSVSDTGNASAALESHFVEWRREPQIDTGRKVLLRRWAEEHKLEAAERSGATRLMGAEPNDRSTNQYRKKDSANELGTVVSTRYSGVTGVSLCLLERPGGSFLGAQQESGKRRAHADQIYGKHLVDDGLPQKKVPWGTSRVARKTSKNRTAPDSSREQLNSFTSNAKVRFLALVT